MFKLFGGKKKDKSFFLELDESKTSQPAEAKPKEAPKISTETASEPVQAAAIEEKKPESAQAKPQKKSVKKAKAAKASKPQAKTQPVAKAAAVSGNGKGEPQIANFATDYLVMQTMSRRRPGPSLNTFKDMARQVKVPRTTK